MSAPAEDFTPPTHSPYGLRWGVKGSFIDYLRRMPDGRASVANGAVPVGINEIFFELDAEPETSPERIEWTFRGDVRFTGHYGMLWVRLARPKLEGTPEAAVLTVDDPDGTEGAPRLSLVTLSLTHTDTTDEHQLWSSTDVALTAAGIPVFNEVYVEGEPFEPLTVRLPL